MIKSYIISSVLFCVEIDDNISLEIDEYIEHNICQTNVEHKFIYEKKILIKQDLYLFQKFHRQIEHVNPEHVEYFRGKYGEKYSTTYYEIFASEPEENWIVYCTNAKLIFVLADVNAAGIYVLRLLRDISYGVNELAGRIFFHCSGISTNGNVVLFMGKKGAGKTTLLVNLIDESWKIVANDRAFLNIDDEKLYVTGFPQSIRIGKGTFNSNPYLKSYYLQNSFFRQNAFNTTTDFKYLVTLQELQDIFHSEYVQTGLLKLIVIPELLENSDIVEVNQMTNLEKKLVLLSQCFSPSDESFTYRWIFESTITSAEISENAANLISIVLDNIPVVKMRYGTKCDYSKVKSEIQNIILG